MTARPLLCAILAVTGTLLAGARTNTYATALLGRIAAETGVAAVTDTLPDGFHSPAATWRGEPLSVEVIGGRVEHIGLRIFDPVTRSQAPSPVYNFLERYLLEMELPLPDGMSRRGRLDADRVSFLKGDLASLHRVARCDDKEVSVDYDNERVYTVTLRGGGVESVTRFPANYALLRGEMLMEAEKKLLQRLRGEGTPTTRRPPFTFDAENLLPWTDEPWPRSAGAALFVLPGAMLDIPQMNSNRYFRLTADGAPMALYDLAAAPVESVCNLFLIPGVAGAAPQPVSVKMLQRGDKNVTFLTDAESLMSELEADGCTPYFGVIAYNGTTGEMDAVVELRNHEQAFEHLLRVRLNTGALATNPIKVTLTPYVPTHDVVR